jgi:dienelactone hydrolase
MARSAETLTLTTRQDLQKAKRELVLHYSSEQLQGQLVLPEHARGVVVSIEETGHCEHQSFHRAIGSKLEEAGIATLLIDLLTPDERADARLAAFCRNHIQLLASRVVAATDWLSDSPHTSCLPIGYFGTGVGSAAALAAAAERPASVSAMVLHSGHPMLVRPALPRVRAATLLITHTSDSANVKLNRAAFSQLLFCEKSLEVVPTLGGDAGALEHVAKLASDWFDHHLVPRTLDSISD